MGIYVHKTQVQEFLARHNARYEVRPHFDMLQIFPVGAPAIGKRVQTGFDVDVFGTLLGNEHLPIYRIEGARMVSDYFGEVAHDIQSRIGQCCSIEIATYDDLIVVNTKDDFRPEGMLRIRIGHSRGMDQPEGPPEEQALEAVRQVLRELAVKEASG
jgi:hypothetical protein